LKQNIQTTTFFGLLAFGGAFLGLVHAAPGQTFTMLGSLGGSIGSVPENMSLVQGADGKFYGTTSQGGANGYGTVFNMSPAGALTVLCNFNGRPRGGANPAAGLVQATNGFFYSTTSGAYADSFGTIFKMSLGGALTTLHEFVETDGAIPGAAMVEAANGDVYGTTVKGGYGYGTIFKVTPKGKFTSLYAFEEAVGESANTLLQAPDGDFYSTAGGGGANGVGTVFKMTPAGVLTTLYTFNTTDGSNPFAGLLLGTDGNFYGTTYGGGANGKGTIFQVTPAGTLTTLHSFTGADGSEPWSGQLVQATDGNFYGTTFDGGAHGSGTIFEFTPGGANGGGTGLSCGRGERDVEGQYVMRIKSWVDVPELHQAANQQSGAGQKNQCHRHFDNHKSVLGAMMSPTYVAGAFFERGVQVLPGSSQRRNQAEEQAGDRGDHQREEQNAVVQPDFLCTWQRRR